MMAREYRLMERCVEDGVSLGLSRARKHTDEPSDEALKHAIESAIMLEIAEWFMFPDIEEIGE